MVEKLQITPDQVIDLKTTFGSDQEGVEDFVLIEDLATTIFFSGVAQRVEAAKEALSRFMSTPTEVLSIEDGGAVYLYLSLTRAPGAYFFIGIYPNQKPRLELAPTDRELSALRNKKS